MDKYRPDKVSSLIKEELSRIFTRELEFDNFLVTIVNVVVSKRLETAIVRIGVFPPEKSPEALIIINENRKKLNALLIGKIDIRMMPKIIFEIEKSY